MTTEDAARNFAKASATTTTRIEVWDLPLRIFHWALVVAVTVAIITAKIGADLIEIHAKAGLTIIGLLAFRMSWGVVGSSTARFLYFLPSPSRVKSYLTGRWTGTGHNPLGALSVIVLLGLLSTQALTGLFSNDDISFTAPLADWVSKEQSDSLTGWHQKLSNYLLIFIGLHVLAVFFYLFAKKNNLIGPMLSGWKKAAPGETPQPIKKAGAPALIISLLVAALAVYAATGRIHFNEVKKAVAPAPAATTTSIPTAAPASSATATPGW